MASPSALPAFCAMLSSCERVPDRPSAFLFASFAASPALPHWSETPSHASRLICRLSVRLETPSPVLSMTCMRPMMACFWRTAVIFRPASVASAEPPFSSTWFSPRIHAMRADVGSFSHALAKSSALICATSANA